LPRLGLHLAVLRDSHNTLHIDAAIVKPMALQASFLNLVVVVLAVSGLAVGTSDSHVRHPHVERMASRKDSHKEHRAHSGKRRSQEVSILRREVHGAKLPDTVHVGKSQRHVDAAASLIANPATGVDVNGVLSAVFDDGEGQDEKADEKADVTPGVAEAERRLLNQMDIAMLQERQSSSRGDPPPKSKDKTAEDAGYAPKAGYGGDKAQSEDVQIVEAAAVKVIAKGKKEKKDMFRAMQFSLVGIVCLVSAFFYASNLADKHIKFMTWKTFSDALSLFAAILIFFADKELSQLFIYGEEVFDSKDKSSKSDDKESSYIYIAGGRLLFLYIVAQLLMWKTKHKLKILNALGLLSAHVIAFTSADFFGYVQEMPPFSDSAGMSLLVIPIALILGLSVRFVGDAQRHKVAHDCAPEEKDIMHDWEHQCSHTEDEFLAFTVGLLLSQFCRFCIEGTMPPIYGYKKKREMTSGQITALAGCGVAFGILTVVIAYFRLRLITNGCRLRGKLKAFVVTSEHITTMAMAWCFYFMSKWLYYYCLSGDAKGRSDNSAAMVEKITMALIFTPVCFVIILLLDKLADSSENLGGVRELNEGVVLLIGLAWEKTFMQALAGDGEYDGDTVTNTVIKRNLFSLTLVAFVVPAWAWYILPRALELEAEAMENCDTHGMTDAEKETHNRYTINHHLEDVISDSEDDETEGAAAAADQTPADPAAADAAPSKQEDMDI